MGPGLVPGWQANVFAGGFVFWDLGVFNADSRTFVLDSFMGSW